MSPDYNYVHSAKVSEYFRVLGLEPEPGSYTQFLREAEQRYRAGLLPQQEHIGNDSKEFEIRGQSVFEIRFQRRLAIEGLWFERNKVIGIHEYDILVKGRLEREYAPFESLGTALSLGGAEVVSEQQLRKYDASGNLWKLAEKQEWARPLLINLNGPYHMLCGDKAGTIRSEEIKAQIASFHGYPNFKVVDYRDWQHKTEL
jgi:hypothetical protein